MPVCTPSFKQGVCLIEPQSWTLKLANYQHIRRFDLRADVGEQRHSEFSVSKTSAAEKATPWGLEQIPTTDINMDERPAVGFRHGWWMRGCARGRCVPARPNVQNQTRHSQPINSGWTLSPILTGWLHYVRARSVLETWLGLPSQLHGLFLLDLALDLWLEPNIERCLFHPESWHISWLYQSQNITNGKLTQPPLKFQSPKYENTLDLSVSTNNRAAEILTLSVVNRESQHRAP